MIIQNLSDDKKSERTDSLDIIDIEHAVLNGHLRATTQRELDMSSREWLLMSKLRLVSSGVLQVPGATS
jgi:hypothetical protein